MKSGHGTWQREKIPSGELDAKEKARLQERRHKAEKRAQTRAEKVSRELEGEGDSHRDDRRNPLFGDGDDSGDDEAAATAPGALGQGKPRTAMTENDILPP